MTDTVRDELRKCIKGYVRQWRINRTGNATTAELAVMALVLCGDPLSITETMCWMRLHSHGFLDTTNNHDMSWTDDQATRSGLGNSLFSVFDKTATQLGDRLEALSH